MYKYFICFVFLLCACTVFAQSDTSSGTGFFVSGNGVIVTCAHVVEDATKITVTINNIEYKAQVLAINPDTDLAILKINYTNPFHYKIVDFNTVNLGDKISVLGFPLSSLLGSDIRLTDGSISAKSGINADQTYFQLSAPIQPGNSGGPIFTNSFEIVGVAAAKLNDMATLAASGSIPQNINFGVKSGYIKTLLGNIPAGTGNVKSMNDAIAATVQIICVTDNNTSGSSIKIANNTGYTVYYVYVSPVTSDSWGADRLGSGVLSTGQTLTVGSLTLGIAYDIHLVDEDGDAYTKRNVRLSPNQTVVFTISDLNTAQNNTTTPITTTPELPIVKIINNTGYTVYWVYISPTSADGWEEDVLDDDVLLNGQSVNVRLPYFLNTINSYDIRLKDSDGDTYTKWNVLISTNKVIEFNIGDLD